MPYADPEKAREQVSRWRKENPGKSSEYSRRYREKHPIDPEVSKLYREEHSGEIREYRRNHRIENLARYQENEKRWKEENPEKVKQSASKWQKKNPEKCMKYTRNWQRDHPEKYKVLSVTLFKRHRARKLGAEGDHTREEVEIQLLSQEGRCAYCWEPLEDGYTEDHVIPVTKEGSDHIENILVACKSCNSSKSDKDVYKWLEGRAIVKTEEEKYATKFED